MSFTAQYSDGDATIKLLINEEFGIYRTLFRTGCREGENIATYESTGDAIIAFSRLVGGELACLAPELEPKLIP
jgi:hypothetical protein